MRLTDGLATDLTAWLTGSVVGFGFTVTGFFTSGFVSGREATDPETGFNALPSASVFTLVGAASSYRVDVPRFPRFASMNALRSDVTGAGAELAREDELSCPSEAALGLEMEAGASGSTGAVG